MRLNPLFLFLGIVFFTLMFFSCKKNETYYINENFNNNFRGWIEETTASHMVKVDSGFYHIWSKDTSSNMSITSAGSLDKTYLLGLPEKYSITSIIILKNNKFNDVNFGLMIYGASLVYSFEIYKSGKAKVLLYDYNSEKEKTVFFKESEFELSDTVHLKININNLKFSFYIDDYEIGNSELKVKSWQEIRFYTSRQSSISIDNFKIKKSN